MLSYIMIFFYFGVIVKILYTFFDQKGEKSEELEAILIKESFFKIVQIPEYAYGISKGDEIEALFISDETVPEFIRFTKKSGNSTLTILQFPSEDVKNKIFQKLEKEFCEVIEVADKWSVNILQVADMDQIQDLLQSHNVLFQVLNPNPYEGNLILPF
jgi:hypothetical protein